MVNDWQWQQQQWGVPLPAGSIITGVGVALSAEELQLGQEQGKRPGVDVLALLGQLNVSVV
jgi:hypothetical protein